MKIGLLLFPNFTQLDLTGPYEVFSRAPEAQVYLIAKNREPVCSEKTLSILPTATFADCPLLDILCVPGGPGVGDVMTDPETLAFLQVQAAQARYVTSVCTGALILAAAGLLDGYKATTHWLSLELLRMFPAVEVLEQRVVQDRNRFTGGGVTAGIDFGLSVVAAIYGDEVAQRIQLSIEYDPAPPFDAGSPHKAPPSAVAYFSAQFAVHQERRKQIIEQLLSKS
ncbi:MAG: DJ-1/PfpI family protein [Spirosomataceae bacterium]